VSVAVLLRVEQGRTAAVRIALGGVAHKPWRAYSAEEMLTGAVAEEPAFRLAAEEAVAEAHPRRHNGFKVELAERLIRRTLTELAGPS
jgi:xanthine dehydrogenase YagS FAD-binding subunit